MDVSMMRGVTFKFCLWALPLCTELSITLSHTCTSRPSRWLFTVLCAFCYVSIKVWVTVFLHCLCPALRIHNHTVLPPSHNSSYVYTNDSAYTNISATVGEDPSLSAHWNSFVHHPLLSVVLSHTHELSVSHFSACSYIHAAWDKEFMGF